MVHKHVKPRYFFKLAVQGFLLAIVLSSGSVLCLAKQKKPPELMTLDDYELESDDTTSKTNETKTSHKKKSSGTNTPWQTKSSLGQFAFTSIRLGTHLTVGSWPKDRTNNAMLSLSLGALLIPSPAYLSLEASTTVSPANPRNFLLDGSLAGGLMMAHAYTAPFLGIRVGVGRMVISGRGQEFGAVLGPELGVFPGRISGKPFSIRTRYSWLPARVNGTKPQWFGLDFGVHL